MSGAPVRRLRPAARVMLLDPDDRALLFRFQTPDFPPFWVMPGGECDPGEDFADAAARELFEETGIVGRPAPVGIVRFAEYDYLGEPVESVEHFFLWRTHSALIDTSRHTEVERRTITCHRWFSAGELGDLAEQAYPLDIADLIRALACQHEDTAP